MIIVSEVAGVTSNLVLSSFNYLLLRGDDDGGSVAPSMVCRHNQPDDLYRFIVAPLLIILLITSCQFTASTTR